MAEVSICYFVIIDGVNFYKLLKQSTMKRVFKDIADRKQVWIALSDLFLDTDTTIFHENIINKLAESPYCIAELKDIMLFEVYPVCRWNLVSIAGEWAGFDEKWLVEKILHKPNILSIIWIKSVGRFSVMTDMGWHKIVKQINYRRAN